jgi:hypothetical protein
MVLRKAHRIAVVRLARDASTLPPDRFIARERILAPLMVRSRQRGGAAGLARHSSRQWYCGRTNDRHHPECVASEPRIERAGREGQERH